MRPRSTETPYDFALEKISQSTPNPTMTSLLLREHPTEARIEFVPCYVWRFGLSDGRPIVRPPNTRYPKHPINFYWGDRYSRHRRICTTQLCCNPMHFIGTPRPPTKIQHALVFEADNTIDQYATLAEAIKGLDIPAQYVLESWRNHCQLRMSSFERSTR